MNVLDAPARMAELERRLGDPWDATGPLPFGRILAADERGEMCADGERVLDEFGLGAEFVPVADGGRLARLDHLVELMRSVYRRDPCLGLGYGAASLIAGVNVWTAGNAEQRRLVAGSLLANRKVACAFHELAHGNDMAGADFTATREDGVLVLRGRKEVVTNIERAAALVVFARTSERHGSRSHSLLLVDKAALPDGAIGHLPRFRTVGMRGVPLGGIEVDGCVVGQDAVIGAEGGALETAMRALQVTRTALVGMSTGILDTGLRSVLRHTMDRRLYGAPAIDIPYLRSVVTGAFVDLLVCEAFAAVAARAIHLLPTRTSVYAPAVKYGVAKPLLDAMHQLSVVLGAKFYLRDGEHGIFQKLLRDLKPVGFGHIGRPVCQTTILPQLPSLGRRSWTGHGEPAPSALFDLGADLPPLPFGDLTVSAGGRDPLAAALPAAVDELGPGGDREVAEVRAYAERFARSLATLARRCAGLAPKELAMTAPSSSYELVDAYVTVLMATSCLRVWRHNQADPFLGDPVWVLAALARLSRPPGGPVPLLPAAVERRLFRELTDRHRDGLGFGIARRPFATSSSAEEKPA